MNNKPIFILANSITNADSMSGGDKNFIENARRWLDWGQKVTIVTTIEGEKMCRNAGLKTNFVILPTIKIKRWGVFLVYLYRIIFGSLFFAKKIKRPVALYSSSDLLPDIFPALLVKLKHPKTFWAVSLNLVYPNPFKGYKKAYTSGLKIPRIKDSLNFINQKMSFFLTRNWGDKIISVNNFYTQTLLNSGFSNTKIATIGRGMDLDWIKKLSEQRKKKYDGVFLGRFHPQKGLFDLVEIWQLVVAQKEKAKLAVIGSGPKKITQKFINMIRNCGLEKNINLLGFLEVKDNLKVLNSSRVFLFPSTYESWGQVAGEAMACGLPVVAYNLPHYEKVFGPAMIRVEIGNRQEFAKKVLELLESKSLRKKKSQQTKNWIKRYNRTEIAKKVLKTLRSDNPNRRQIDT